MPTGLAPPAAAFRRSELFKIIVPAKILTGLPSVSGKFALAVFVPVQVIVPGPSFGTSTADEFALRMWLLTIQSPVPAKTCACAPAPPSRQRTVSLTTHGVAELLVKPWICPLRVPSTISKQFTL